MESYKTAIATAADVQSLERLVNSAYREKDAGGWTTESHLLDGIRVDAANLLGLIQTSDSIVLKALNAANELVGCVHLQLQDKVVYLGMLSVWPSLQDKGIGGYLLQAAELWTKQEYATAISITVLSGRVELIAWYERKGFVKTGAAKAFPNDPRFGIPKEKLKFIEMKKDV